MTVQATNGVYVAPQTQTTSAHANTAKTASTAPIVSMKQQEATNKPKELTQEQIAAQERAKEALGKYFDVKATSDGYLIISANNVPKSSWNDMDPRRLDEIKTALRLEDGVLREHNPYLRSNISLYYTPNWDEGVLTGSVRVPISEVGKNPNILQLIGDFFKDLF